MTVNPRCYCGGGLFAPWAALYGLLLRGGMLLYSRRRCARSGRSGALCGGMVVYAPALLLQAVPAIRGVCSIDSGAMHYQ